MVPLKKGMQVFEVFGVFEVMGVNENELWMDLLYYEKHPEEMTKH